MLKEKRGDIIFFLVTILIMWLLFTVAGCATPQKQTGFSYYATCENLDGSPLYEGFIKNNFRYHYIGDRFSVLAFTTRDGKEMAARPDQCDIQKVIW